MKIASPMIPMGTDALAEMLNFLVVAPNMIASRMNSMEIVPERAPFNTSGVSGLCANVEAQISVKAPLQGECKPGKNIEQDPGTLSYIDRYDLTDGLGLVPYRSE